MPAAVAWECFYPSKNWWAEGDMAQCTAAMEYKTSTTSPVLSIGQPFPNIAKLLSKILN
jgi:hypothetical protein